MTLVSKILLAVILCLNLVANGQADDKKPAGKDQETDRTITIHGVISGFTMLGETDVDQNTGKVMTAEATLVTVIGHPWMHEGDKAHAAANDKDKSDTKEHASHHHHRMNLYIAALTPQTKVCEVMSSGKEVALTDKDANYDDLEIGDRVELIVKLKEISAPENNSKPVGEDVKKGTAKHGRHRTYLGSAVQIKLMPDQMEGMHREGNSEQKEAK